MQEHESIGMKVMYMVWIGLLVVTIIEVLMAYFQMPLTVMLLSLIGLSVFKAVLIMAYFMHLKFERLNLILTLIPAMVVCILLLNLIFPDAIRITTHGIFR